MKRTRISFSDGMTMELSMAIAVVAALAIREIFTAHSLSPCSYSLRKFLRVSPLAADALPDPPFGWSAAHDRHGAYRK